MLRRFFIGIGIALVLVLVAGTVASAKTLFVATHGIDGFLCGAKASPCRSIGLTILLAAEGDSISVGPGYYGDLNANGVLDGAFSGEEFVREGCNCMVLIDKRLQITSERGAAATILDTGSAAIDVVKVVADKVVVGKQRKGFTLTGGVGVVVEGGPAKVTIAGNRIALSRPDSGIPNHAIAGGGPDIVIADNVISNDGVLLTNGVGAVLSGGARGRILRNVVTRASGTAFDTGGDGLKLLDNVALFNHGSGVNIKRSNSKMEIRGNTLVGNRGPAIHLGSDQPGLVITKNNIFGNDGFGGSNCGLASFSTTPLAVSKNFWGAAGGPGADPADGICDRTATSTTVVKPAAKPYPVKATAGR